MKSVSLIASSEATSSIPPIPDGVHIGALVSIHDLGTTYNEVYDKRARKVIFTFEFPELDPIEVERDGKKVKIPRTITKQFTKSLHEKAGLLAFINSWRGKKLTADQVKAFDLTTLLHVGGQFQVLNEEKDGKTRSKINAVMPLPRGAQVAVQTPKTVFSVDQLDAASELDQVDLAKWMRERVVESEEYQRLVARAPAPVGAAQLVKAASAAENGLTDDEDTTAPF